MSNSPYPSNPDPSFNQPSVESSNAVKYAELDRTVQDIRIENTRLDQDVQKLQGRTAALIGLLIGLILLTIGGFTWLAIELQNINQEERQDASNVDAALSDRVEQLEKQIDDLSKNVPGNLTDTLKSNQTALAQLQTQLQQITTQIKTLERSPSPVQPQPNISPPDSAPSSQQSPESPQLNP